MMTAKPTRTPKLLLRAANGPGIPETVRHRTKWSQALEMIDELSAWGHQPPSVVADAGYGEITAFRQGLSERGISCVLAVRSATPPTWPPRSPNPRSTPGEDHAVFPDTAMQRPL